MEVPKKIGSRFTALRSRGRARGRSEGHGASETSRLARAKRRLKPGGWHNWLLGLVCAAVIVLAITSIGSSSSSGSGTGKRTAKVGRGIVQSTASGNGSLEALQQVELNFGASGEVTAIYVSAGEEVSEGEVLARIDSSSAEASLASAKAQLYEAEESLEAAEEAEEAEEEESEETSASYSAEASIVLAAYDSAATATTEGETTTGAATTPTETTTPEQEKAEEEKEEAEKEKEKEKEAAEKEQEKAEKEKEMAEKEAAPEESAPETTEAAPEAAPESSIEGGGGEPASPQATVSVPTAEANLRQARLSVKSARQEVRETALRAPIGGTIASISGSVGESVSGESSGAASGGSEEAAAGGLGAVGGTSSSSSSSSSSSAFIVLAQLDRLKMEVSFSESDIGKVKVGQTATVSISSMEGTELAGRVTNVDVMPSEGSSSVVEYPATILVTQSAKGVRAGMSASAEVVVEEVQNAVTVTSEAITSGPSKTVTVEEEGGKEATKTVTTGLVGDETTEIVSGLKAGETVVLPEVTVASGGLEGGEGGESGFPGGGGFPSGGGGFPGGGFPSGGGFPGGP